MIYFFLQTITLLWKKGRRVALKNEEMSTLADFSNTIIYYSKVFRIFKD